MDELNIAIADYKESKPTEHDRFSCESEGGSWVDVMIEDGWQWRPKHDYCRDPVAAAALRAEVCQEPCWLTLRTIRRFDGTLAAYCEIMGQVAPWPTVFGEAESTETEHVEELATARAYLEFRKIKTG